jgi:predicted choloylglycine hydrolase
MFHSAVKGSYYDMGCRYGSALYKHGFKVEPQRAEKLDFGKRSEKDVQQFFPEILGEIQGFADACHASYDDLSAFLFCVGAFKVEPFCSVFAAFNGSDVVFGRNYDFYYSFAKYSESFLTCPKNGYFSMGHSDVFVGREDGVNEKGLAVAMTGVMEKTTKPGVSFIFAVRYVLDKCATVEEALKALPRLHFSSANDYLLADAGGNMAVVEASPEKVMVRTPEEGERFIVCTNHYVLPEMLKIENLKERPPDSVLRYTTIYGALQQHGGKIDAKTAQEILADHGGYVCSHIDSIKLGTIWSVVASLKQRQILRAEGHPCKIEYKKDYRLTRALKAREKRVRTPQGLSFLSSANS